MGKWKFNLGDRVTGSQKKASFRDRKGVIIERGPGRAEYKVQFDDGRIEYVNSWWLDRVEN